MVMLSQNEDNSLVYTVDSAADVTPVLVRLQELVR